MPPIPEPDSGKAEMETAEFDSFADEYYAMLANSISGSGERPEYFAEYKINDIYREYSRRQTDENHALKILDFGAGVGSSIPYVRKFWEKSQLTCIDPSQRRLNIAKQRFPRSADFIQSDGISIPSSSEYFDIVYATCVFHHIDQKAHKALVQEIYRVLRPGGYIFIFEHNPYNPVTTRIVNQCPFDKNAKLIHSKQMEDTLLSAGFDNAASKYKIFFPHVLRVLRPLERAMTWLPLGAQYYTMAKK